MSTVPRLIEVALPIREISAESVRDKSLRPGHISTLHLWWARRPLPASRAVVFASLVPDPDHTDCPKPFRKAVMRLLHDEVPAALKGYRRGKSIKRDADPYHPYKGIADTPRNRLLAFIAKWSPEWLAFERGEAEKQPPPAEMLDDRSLVKWETSDPQNEQGRAVLGIARELARLANGGKPPTVLDPFAGGGAIPLEAARLGCQAIANDYNPVAYLILRATCEFPQMYGKPGLRTRDDGVKSEGATSSVFGHSSAAQVPNILAYDLEYWASWMLKRAHERIGQFYPTGQDGHPVVGYLWARTTPCSNPSCQAEIPLLRSLLVCNKPGKRVALVMTRHSKTKEVQFSLAQGRAITETAGTMIERGGGDVRCPICGQTTPVEHIRRSGLEGRLGERMVAVITATPGSKVYRAVESIDLEAFEYAKQLAEKIDPPREPIRPEVSLSEEHVSNRGDITVHLYGMKTWGSLFNPRQLLVMQTLVDCLHDALAELEKSQLDEGPRNAIATYLGLWVSRNAMRSTTVGRWDSGGETFQSPFDMAKIAMMWDFAEANPFSGATGSALSQLDWILRVVKHEALPAGVALPSAQVICGDGSRLPFATATANVVVTDPPYFDEIAYADLSDLFYVWLKRGIGEVFPEVFSTPLTPKREEATALSHRHAGSAERAEEHFTSKLAACFVEAKRMCKPDGILTVMFAHQTTDAWTALIKALFDAGVTVTATYPIDTELKNRARGLDSSALESSITVTCRDMPRFL